MTGHPVSWVGLKFHSRNLGYFCRWKKLTFPTESLKKTLGTTLLLHCKSPSQPTLETLWNLVKYSETLWNFLFKVSMKFHTKSFSLKFQISRGGNTGECQKNNQGVSFLASFPFFVIKNPRLRNFLLEKKSISVIQDIGRCGWIGQKEMKPSGGDSWAHFVKLNF